MHTHRFGRKLKLPSTTAIKHGILSMMLRDELTAQAFRGKAEIAVDHGASPEEEVQLSDRSAVK